MRALSVLNICGIAITLKMRRIDIFVSSAEDVQAERTLVERSIRSIAAEFSAPVWKSNPFRGMRLFDFEHAPVFHGRTKAVGEVLDALKKQASAKKPFVLVLGASGSGKSSLVRAGVLPLLTEVGTVDGDGPWRRAVTRPGPGGASGDPFDALAVALLAKGGLPELEKVASCNEWRNLAAELREHPDSVGLRVKELLDRISFPELDHLLDEQDAQSPLPGTIESVELARQRRLRRVKPKAQLALVIDQLEDLFASGFSEELQQRYIAVLAALVRSQRVFVIAALRSDFYASYLQFPELVALVGPSGRFDLLPPTRSELRSIIRLPAESAGLRFERDIKANQALDEALTDAAMACAEPLPLLEHLLSQLYRKQLDRGDGLLRWSDYRELGEFEEALANHAETVFTALNSDARQTFELVMRQLASLGPADKALCRPMPYQDLVSSRELDHRLKMGAKSLVDCMVKEGLFNADPDPKQEVFISVAHPALLRRWPRVQLWLAEDREFLRMQDRLNGCLKLWLNRGRQNHHLLRLGSELADGETLINHFHFSLSEALIDYIKKSIAAQRRGQRIRNIVALAVLMALASLAAVVGVRWVNTESQRKSLDEYTIVERRIAEIAQSERGATQNAAKSAEGRAQRAEQRADLASTQLGAIEARLKQVDEKTQQNADITASELGSAQTELKKAEEKAQLAQQSADLATAQRGAIEAQLKKAEEKAQLAQQSADLATTQRGAMEAQLKKAEEKAQLAQQSADLATTQRSAMEAQLKKAEEKAQLAQQSADLATTQRSAMEAQLKKAEEKAQLAQQSADLATTQRSAMEAQLKKAEQKAQLAQQSADLATTQRSAMEAQLKKAEEKAQLAQQSADLATTQRSAMEAQLKQSEEKAQLAQQSADLATTQRSAMEAQLKKAEEKARLAQKIADLVSAESQAGETGSSKGEPVKKSADLPANRPRSGRALPLDAGQNAQPALSTQPLLPPVQSASH
jgi:AAA ATPase domain